MQTMKYFSAWKIFIHACKPYAIYSKPNTQGQISILYESTYKVPRRGKSIVTDWVQEKGMSEDEMFEWHHQLDGHESEQTWGDSEGQGSLLRCNPPGHKELDTTQRLYNNNTETESRMALDRGGGDGELRLVGTEFQFGKMQKFWRWIEVMVSQRSEYMNILIGIIPWHKNTKNTYICICVCVFPP